MDVIDRLHAAVKASKIPKKRIAHLIGTSPSRLSRLLNHRVESPSIYEIEAVARVIGVSMEMLYAEYRETPAEVTEARAALKTLTAFVDHHDASAARRPVANVKKTASRRARPFPVAATPNVELFERPDSPGNDIPDELWSRGARHAARVIGDSMIDAGIDPGDVVFFRPATSVAAARGKVVVCRHNQSAYLKRLDQVGDEIRLLSENERYKPVVVATGDDFELYGVVVFPAK